MAGIEIQAYRPRWSVNKYQKRKDVLLPDKKLKPEDTKGRVINGSLSRKGRRAY